MGFLDKAKAGLNNTVNYSNQKIDEAKFNSDIYAVGLELTNMKGKVLATLGIVSNKILSKFDIQQEVYYADLNWKALMKDAAKVSVQQQEISKFPPVKRDLALLVDNTVQFAEIEKIVIRIDCADAVGIKLPSTFLLLEPYENVVSVT